MAEGGVEASGGGKMETTDLNNEKISPGKQTNKQKTYTLKTIGHRGKKLRKIQRSGSTYCVHGLEELKSLKCPYYPKHFVDSMQFLLK